MKSMLKDKLQEAADGRKCPLAVIMKDGKILTGLRHYRKDLAAWTVPGGRSEIGETLEQALRREVREEVNIDNLRIIDFIGEHPGAREGDTVFMFLCTTSQEPELMEPEKFSEWRWLTKDEYIHNKAYAGFSPSARKMVTDFLEGRG